ncbi:Cyclic di-GMP phosphodiesterase Gmr [Caloramator mitchellensis]|uniref:Cyclic di-GMP phosphodiesterase Gmr n=1 Tax=Caloramator mitchellensis TaxID=908809 RepID=A0A0R3JVG7_CALMK|nr:EAL domain-containing protein [Caloramator mitchellensis]KRQ87593.1 Cyclic di-GMP phosphodiesterase Gmr [Caloramator mitchellensis]
MNFFDKNRIINYTSMLIFPLATVFLSIVAMGYFTYSIGKQIILEIIHRYGIEITNISTLRSIHEMIYKYSIISIFIAIILILIIIINIRITIVKPLDIFIDELKKIDVEKNISYRLKISEDDRFAGLKFIINSLLDRIELYISRIQEQQAEMAAFNDELSATVQQLTATEEELKMQNDELQSYVEKLEELQQKYDIAIHGSNSAIWEIDLKDNTIEVSQNFKELVNTKYSNSKNVHEFLDMLLMKEDKEILMKCYNKYKSNESNHIYSRIRIIDDNNNIRWFLVTGRGLKDNKGKLKKLHGVLVEVTKLKIQEEKIEFLAYNDHLTGLPNRIKFTERLNGELNNGKKGAILLIDLDNFKNINDTLGHVYGDTLLEKLAKAFKTMSNENIEFFRFGGDEFLVLYKNQCDVNIILAFARKILELFEDDAQFKFKDNYLTASIGIAIYPEHGNSIDEILMNADTAMYRAKYSGKNKYVLFESQMSIKLKEKIELENILRKAIDGDGFMLHYQPIVDVKDGRIVSFEALTRMKNKNISPAKFIPLAEETNLIVVIGKWVIKKVAEQLNYWKSKGIEVRPIAINISPKQIKDEGFIYYIQDTLDEYNIEPRLLEIEITESIMVENKEEILKILQKLKEIGLTIALDDFGTGYSSLNYLTYIPVDKIKLDKSLSDKFLELDNLSVMSSIIMLAHSLNLKVTAEGIETESQYQKLKNIGCDFVQGYFFSMPLPHEEAERKLLD